MKVIEDKNFNKLIADEGKHIREKNDIYVPEHEEDGQIIPEHFPYYSTLIFLPISLKKEQIFNMYVEEDISSEESSDLSNE